MSKNKMWLYSAVVALAFAFNANAGVSGFADAQFQVNQGSESNQTFAVADGAVYFTEKAGSSSVTVDIPFSGGTGTSSAFTIAGTKSQAYISHGYDFGLTWHMGQWDSIYAHENNDSHTNRHSAQGLLYAAAPKTHAGLRLDYASGAVEVNAYIANPANAGLRGGDNFDFGGKLKYTHSMFYISGGYQHHKSAASGESSMYTDFTLGTKQGAFSADAEVALAKAAVAGAETGLGFGVWLAYAWNDTCDIAGRFEYASKLAAYSQVAWAVGPQHKFNDKASVRLDYIGMSTTPIQGATSVSSNGGNLSTVFKF